MLQRGAGASHTQQRRTVDYPGALPTFCLKRGRTGRPPHPTLKVPWQTSQARPSA